VQLKDYLRQLRSLRPSTEGIVAVVNSVPLQDISRVGLRRFGPFESHDAFYQFLRANYPLDTFPIVEGSAEVIAAHSQSYATGFTHGDVAPRNIFLKNDRTVTGIVHWRYSGWYRTESIRKQTIPYAPDDWVLSIGEITGAFEEQLAGERQLYSLCGYMLTYLYFILIPCRIDARPLYIPTLHVQWSCGKTTLQSVLRYWDSAGVV
jgi:hypothetical protein